MTAVNELEEWERKLKSIKQDVGENPGRFLDRKIPNPPPRNSMFRARLEGIDRLETVGAFEAAERILSERDGREPRAHVMELLDRRRDYLVEHGERPESWGVEWLHELPDRYRPSARDREVPDKEWFWRGGPDKSGEQRPWSRRPTSVSVGGRVFETTQAVATDGGDEQ